MRFLVKLIINALALWFTTMIVAGVHVTPFEQNSDWATIITYLLLALIFGFVNGVVGTVVRIVAFPLYIITLGLVAFIVNAFLLWIVAWISGLMGFGLTIDSFWSGVWGALVLAIVAWLIGLVLRPLTRDR